MRDFYSPDDTQTCRSGPSKRASGGMRFVRGALLAVLAFGAAAGVEAARRAVMDTGMEYTAEGVPIYKRPSYRVLGDGTIVYPQGHELVNKRQALVPNS